MPPSQVQPTPPVQTAASAAPKAPPGSPQPVFGLRLACGLLGILLGAIIAGLNNRVPGLVLADVQGGLGFASDDASWLTTAYAAGELAAMPFASWFAITFSLKRFHVTMLSASLVLAAFMPFAHRLEVMLALRALQGLCSGALIPLLMMAALRFLPPKIRLHGLALYALTATFAPNLALWLASLCVEHLEDWRWAYWHVLPLGALALPLVAWGVPRLPMALERLPQGNWLGMALGIPGLALLVTGLDQGVRLDWWHSSVVAAALFAGGALTVLFLLSEWRHATPFMRLQLLVRRNLGLGFTVFFLLLMTLNTAVGLPANTLAHGQGFRLAQTAPLGLIVAWPQLVLGPAVALLLYQRWVDARHVFAAGLVCIGVSCWMASGLTDEWMVRQFLWIQVLQAVGQPLAVVPLLFLATSVVQPMEGPSVSGLVNMLRALGTVSGGAFIGEMLARRQRFHAEMLLDTAASALPALGQGAAHGVGAAGLSGTIAAQAAVLATADVYRIFGTLALVLVPVVLRLQHIPAPMTTPPPLQPTAVPVAPAR
ncbi:Major Facilitator Superfamily protein [Roseateles sp. YR242]|uniref:MFS transporter n=1 Tax=Roseateles sp. YR242 TaxID=1855305 RepID=UPI0008C4CA40|nr:MFS transporter [Roseateles sp. YR242]SEL39019.1 Major Facilitator Superfamily protein [Roseateles sp. YR242]